MRDVFVGLGGGGRRGMGGQRGKGRTKKMGETRKRGRGHAGRANREGEYKKGDRDREAESGQ